MVDIRIVSLPALVTFLLVLARLGGLLGAAPLFGHIFVPRRVRALLALLFAASLAPGLPQAPEVEGVFGLAGLVAAEAAFGVLLGLMAQFIFAGVQLAGQLAGIQMGLGLANLVDPETSGHQITAVAEWEHVLALLTFLALDGHHLLVRGVVESFRVTPPGRLGLTVTGAIPGLLALAGEMFVIAVRVAAPVLVALLLANAAMGVLARTIPQLNVFVVGFPVNVGIGLLMLGVGLPLTLRFLAARFGSLGWQLGGALTAVGAAGG